MCKFQQFQKNVTQGVREITQYASTQNMQKMLSVLVLFTQLAGILHDHRPRRSWQISSLGPVWSLVRIILAVSLLNQLVLLILIFLFVFAFRKKSKVRNVKETQQVNQLKSWCCQIQNRNYHQIWKKPVSLFLICF